MLQCDLKAETKLNHAIIHDCTTLWNPGIYKRVRVKYLVSASPKCLRGLRVEGNYEKVQSRIRNVKVFESSWRRFKSSMAARDIGAKFLPVYKLPSHIVPFVNVDTTATLLERVAGCKTISICHREIIVAINHHVLHGDWRGVASEALHRVKRIGSGVVLCYHQHLIINTFTASIPSTNFIRLGNRQRQHLNSANHKWQRV